MHTKEETLKAFGRLYDVMLNLRQKCPWDKKQTEESLRTNTIEEVYELSDALLKNDECGICEEVGDVLEHVLFYSIFGDEKKNFDIADVCNKEAEKLISRHPHIYGNVKAENADDVVKTWEQIKTHENIDGEQRRVLSGVPKSLPSIIKAYRIQEKARGVGFDWAEKEQVWEKVHEELGELEVELKKDNNEEAALNELGDYLFSIINAARLYHLNPDNALEHTNNKFIDRFNYIEQCAIDEKKNISDMSLAEMDQLWNEAKEREAKK